MRTGSRERKGVSEILASLIMIVLTMVGFAVIAPGLVSRTQAQASTVMQEYQDGSIKLGQMLSVVYHSEEASTWEVGVYDYGTQSIPVLYAFVSTPSGPCEDGCQCPWSLTPAGSTISPQTPVQIDLSVASCKTAAGTPVPTLSPYPSYQLFVYSTDGVGYSFSL